LPAQVDEFQVSIKFGGGQNSSASETDIDPRECSTGQNFEIDFKNFNLRNRKPFDLMGTAPNGLEIKGFANLVQADGTTTMLVQAGGNVYQWSKSMGWALKGTVNVNSQLRGPLSHYWSLDDLVLITDINLRQPVMTWDGSALSTFTHNLTGDFYAKYCLVNDERARFGNVISNSTATPHMIVTSKLSDYQTLTISNRPSESLGADDPYYVLTPDLRAINGMQEAFGTTYVSSEKGSIFKIDGADSTDTDITALYPRSFAVGDESTAFVGNDIVYGRIGRIESLVATVNYGDVLANDLSIPISDEIEDITSWNIVFNPRTQKAYCHPEGENYIWVLNKSLIDRLTTQNYVSSKTSDSPLSPWVKITTGHSSNLNPTAMMCIVDPDDGLEYVYWGDENGNLYRMEGTGAGDAGSAEINTVFGAHYLLFQRT
jgi:hypothetical protein